MNAAKFQGLLNFAKPAAAEWPCQQSMPYVYQSAGLWEALPADQLPEELRAARADAAKVMRKMFRAMNMDPNAAGKETFSNIELIPIRAQCANDKLDGSVEYYAKYDSVRETPMEMLWPATNKMEKSRSVMNSSVEAHVIVTFKDGKIVPEGMLTVRKTTSTSKSIWENPEIQKLMDKSAAITGKPITNTSIQANAKGGHAMFMPTMTAKVSSGFLGPKTELDTKLMVMIMLTGDGIQENFSYTDGLLTGKGRTNPETRTTESITYMDNYLPALGKKLSEMPNMENFREVNLGGRNLLEMHSCMVNNAPVRMDPCPVEQ